MKRSHGWLGVLALLPAAYLSAQAAPPARAGGPPPTPKTRATVDLTGYWVSVVTEDWLYRMVTPAKGDYF